MGLKQIRGNNEGLFPALSRFPKCCLDPPNKGKKGRQGGQTRPISRQTGEAPLKPPSVAVTPVAADPWITAPPLRLSPPRIMALGGVYKSFRRRYSNGHENV